MSKSYLNLETTYQFAVKKLAVKGPEEMARNSGVKYDREKKMFTLNYLGREYHVSYPDGSVKPADETEELPLTDMILILHYLSSANGAPLQNTWISFKELPDGAIYIEPFTRRTIQPMLNLFAARPEEFIKLALTLGGKFENLGNTSVTIYPFPRVPITYVIWSGDDEFPASGNILFDASAPNYLPTEDFVILSGLIIYRLGRFRQEMK